MPRKPLASLGVYYEQDDKCNRGILSYPQIILGNGWDLLKSIKSDLTAEQVETLQIATDASPPTSPPGGLTIQTTTSGQKSYAEVVKLPSEQEGGEEEEANEKALVANHDEGLRQEKPMKIIKYNLSNDNKRDCWESVIAVPEDTPKVKIGKAFVRTLWT